MKSTEPKTPKQETTSTQTNGSTAPSDAHSLSIGSDGPLALHDSYHLEQIQHFNREKVIERNPHAKGSGAFGVFEATADMSRYTRAALFQKGAKTEVLARFSTVAGEKGSPDTWRDVRGFSLKFYTSEGNYDLVGNNTPVFFMRDPMKFPHFIRSQRRLPDSGLRDNHMQWDFWTLSPASAHQVTYLMGDRGLPKNFRAQNGYGSHTFMWINEKGEKFWVKYHFHAKLGFRTLTGDEAKAIAGKDADAHRRDLFDAIKAGDFPSWTVSVQLMPYADAAKYRFNPFDLTKVWPHGDFPLIKIGVMTLNRNPANFHAEIEQAAFSPSATVPGIGLSPDKMLLSRAFAYHDAALRRIGTNFHQLPVNQPKTPQNAYMFDGDMTYHHTGNAAVYAPNSAGRAYSEAQLTPEDSWKADGELVRQTYKLHKDDDDFGQAGALVRNVMDEAARKRLINTVCEHLDEGAGVKPPVRQRVFDYWKSIDKDVGAAMEKAAK